MRGRIWTVAVGIAALVAVVVVPAAMAAYTSPKLEVTQTATGVVLKASVSPDDDPTARIAINVPVGTTLTTSQAPGAVLGPARAVVKSLDNFGIDVPIEGQIVVAPPGQVATGQQACIGSSVPIATWQLTGSALGVPLSVPMYLLPSRRRSSARHSSSSACRPPTCPRVRPDEPRRARRCTARS